ncbi:MAG: hypothetical protein NTY66_02910 [Candidatus Vogelbacteria bacterium]|nr:hypothetical protein [Candidatus Vogelbacteria bacterium]
MFLLFVLIVTILIIIYRPWTMAGVGPIGLVFAFGTRAWGLAVFFGGISAVALLSLCFTDPDILPSAPKYWRSVNGVFKTLWALLVLAVAKVIDNHPWLEKMIDWIIRAWQKFNLPGRLRRRFQRRLAAELRKERHPGWWARTWNRFWQVSGW